MTSNRTSAASARDVGAVRRWLAALGLAAVACTSTEVSFGAPLDLQITSSSPVSVSDSLRVNYEIVGRSLVGLSLEWGDGQVDSIGLSGAQSAGGYRSHSYAASGDYTVSAYVLDQFEGSASRELTVTIQP